MAEPCGLLTLTCSNPRCNGGDPVAYQVAYPREIDIQIPLCPRCKKAREVEGECQEIGEENA